MKKVLFLLFASILVLSACGDDNEQTEEDNISQAEDEQEVLTETDDPMEFGNRDNGYEVYNHGQSAYEFIEWYSSDLTDEEGFNTVTTEDGYEFTFSLALMHDVNSDQEVIGIFGEHNNESDEDLVFLDTPEVITDEQEQASTTFGLDQGVDSGVRSKVFDVISLEYDSPESFTMTVYYPRTGLEDEGDQVLEELEFTAE
ncbi:hypothetical protein [Oceanobacillus oncorhynchi]|uniref:hypothetical protein n=1 Tax=Oceanobacillus oncorhynchi TaxID=545501 RepID=UPI001865DC9C|nr:hypothetical protein [Oceanobacillus oncorhynchi]